jgi:hypothetical protein
MKRITALALFAATSILGVGSALAQDLAVRATMPFAFTVGNKLLPPGTYTIIPVHRGIIAIRSWDANVGVLSTAISDSNQSQNGSKLVFTKYGDQYFLREILGGSGGGLNVSLPLTNSEKRARNQQTLAFNQSQISVSASKGN